MPFSREELTFGFIPDLNSKSLCSSLAGNPIDALTLYENTQASVVFEFHVLKMVEQYNERILNKRFRR